MCIEVALSPLHFLLAEQEQVAHLAVSKGINDGLAYKQRNGVVDSGTQAGSDGSKEDEQKDVQLARGSRMIGSRRDDDFRRNGEYRALESHQEKDGIVI